MPKPRPEAPYVAFPKSLFDALLASPMPAVHKAVMFAVVRMTIGYRRGERPHDAAPISVSRLEKATGHHRTRVSKARQDLVREGPLIEASPATYSRSAVLYANSDPSTWGAYAPNQAALCWEAAECCQAANGDKSGSRMLPGGQQNATKGAAECCPLKNEEPIEERNGRSPADDTEGPAGDGPEEDAPADAEQISEILDGFDYLRDRNSPRRRP